MIPQYCSQCKSDVVAEVNDANGFTCCTVCGKILDDSVFSTDPTFSKTSGGAIQVDGNFVPESGIAHSVGRPTRGGRVFGLQIDSHEKTVNKGKQEINQIADRLAMKPREDITTSAHRLYKIAVSRNFTRGRRTAQVAGACLYVVCRQENRPYMLIDFSDVLQTNVYVLGGVFLQLCRLMRLEQHPLMQRPIDPSLFIHRFADKMNLGKRVHSVSNTALRLVASMKRDWMQTGRRPAGICGAALWVASHVHGFDRSKSDVVSIVHIGEQTLKKRITEFSSTPAALLSVEEFDAQAQKYENDDFIGSKEQQDLICSGSTTLTCKHRDDDNMPEHFQHGMCRACYIDYVKVSGGTTFLGGMDPPAFTAAQKKREMEQLQPRILRIANFEAGQAEVQAEFEGALLEGEINEFAMIAGVVQGSAPAAGAANAGPATAAAQTQIEERRPPQVIRQVQVQRVVLKEPPFKFMIEAEKVLKRIVGTKPAETHCLPFVHGKAKGCVLREHFRDDIGEFTKDIRLEIMHYLINLGCFDDGALEHLNTLYPSHDLILLGKEDFTPPENTVKIEVDNKAEKAKKEAAENIRKYKVNKEPPPPGTSFNDIIKKNEEALRNLNNLDVKKEEGKTENGVDTPTNDEEEMRDVCSDIEDEDINEYMNNQEQVNLKRVIWSEMNKDYLESQAAKEAASKVAAARESNQPPRRKYNTKKKEEKYQRAENAAVAAQTVLIKKRGVSSKINYEALQNLFDDKGEAKKKKKASSAVAAAKDKAAPKETTTTTTKAAALSAKKASVAGRNSSAAATTEATTGTATAKQKREKEEALPVPAAKKTATKPASRAAAAVAEKMKGKKKAPPPSKEKSAPRATRASRAVTAKKFIKM